ncbi:MAG: Uma2 family endonuclease [Cyanobacteria bacterium J06638_20]
MTQTTDKPALMKWGLEQYHKAVKAGVFEGCRVELLRGDIVEMSPIEPLHDDIQEELAVYLRSMLGDRARVREAKAITLPDNSEPIPDISVVKPQRYRDRHPHVEDVYLLIEIANSRPIRDTKVKRLIYAEAGIPEYWVFDLKQDELRIFRDVAVTINGSDYQTDIICQNDPLSIQAFPDVVLSATAMMRLIE